MWYWLLLLIPVLILFLPFKVIISIKDVFLFEIKFLGVKVFKFVSKSEPEKKKASLSNFDFKLAELKNYIKVIKELFVILEKYVRKKLTFSRLIFQISYGNGNAAETAIRCGLFYAVVYNLFGYLSRRYKIKSHTINVTPDFESAKTEIEFYISTRINLFSLISLFVQEKNALMSLNNILKKKDGVVNE